MRLRRTLLAFAALVLWLMPAQAAGEVTLYYWGRQDDVLAPELIQDFEAIHDGTDGGTRLRVVMAQSASVNMTDDPQRLLCGIAGGDPPDVVFFDRFAVGEWAARGAFLNLQPLLERDQEEHPKDPNTLYEEQFYRPCWEEASFEGELFAVPSETDNRAMYYNKDLFDRHAEALIAAGCTDPEDPTKVGPPRTWAQLERAVAILTERGPDGNLVRVGFIPTYGNSWLYLYGWLNGGQFLSSDGRTCLLDSPRNVEALAYVSGLYELMGGVRGVSAFQISQEGGEVDPFLGGQIAMRVDLDTYVNVIANLQRDLRFGVALAPAPEGKQPLGWSGGWSYVIPANAGNPDEAWTFIKYMVSRRAARIRTEAGMQSARAAGTVYIPPLHARKDLTHWVMETYYYSDPTIPERFKDATRLFVETMPFARHRPVTPVGQALWNAQVNAMEEGIYMRLDPENRYHNAEMALAKYDKMVQRELDRIYKAPDYPELNWRPIVAVYIVLLVLATAFGYWYFNRQTHASGYFRKEFYAGYLFASPWFVGFALVGGGPLLFSLFMSFCQYDIFHAPKWVGLRNYYEMFFLDELFYLSLWNTVFMAIGIPLGMAVSLAIAMLLSYEIKGMAVYRTFFYLPAIVPAVAASILWRWILNPQQGVLNMILNRLGLPGPLWLQDPAWSKPALILMMLWGAGAGMIVWLAGLKGIPKHLYEAAEIDGAGPWGKFRNVTLPMLSPYILFNLVMGLIGTFQIFTQAYIMTQGGPVNSTLFYAYNLFNQAFRYMRMGYASAMAWVLFFIILGLTVIQLHLSKKWVHYESDR